MAKSKHIYFILKVYWIIRMLWNSLHFISTALLKYHKLMIKLHTFTLLIKYNLYNFPVLQFKIT